MVTIVPIYYKKYYLTCLVLPVPRTQVAKNWLKWTSSGRQQLQQTMLLETYQMKLVQHHVLVLSCVVCGSAVEAGGPLTGPLPSFTYGNMVCWAAYCIPYSNFLGQYHRTYGLSHMDGIVLVCSTLLSRSLPVFLYAKTFKTGDGQVYSNCPVDKSVRSIKTSGQQVNIVCNWNCGKKRVQYRLE